MAISTYLINLRVTVQERGVIQPPYFIDQTDENYIFDLLKATHMENGRFGISAYHSSTLLHSPP
jgi:hypothetical protein